MFHWSQSAPGHETLNITQNNTSYHKSKVNVNDDVNTRIKSVPSGTDEDDVLRLGASRTGINTHLGSSEGRVKRLE